MALLISLIRAASASVILLIRSASASASIFVRSALVDLSQYLGHILVETVMSFFLLPNLQTPEGLDSESNYEVDSGYKIPQYS